jgi:hypothetical protein
MRCPVSHQFFYELFRTLETRNINTIAHRMVVKAFFGPPELPDYPQDTFTLTIGEIASLAHISEAWAYTCLRKLVTKKIAMVAKADGERYSVYKLTPEFRGKIDELLGINTKA